MSSNTYSSKRVLPESRAEIEIECPSHVSSIAPLAEIERFPPLADWINNLDRQISKQQTSSTDAAIVVDRITLQSVDVFKSGKIGFVKFAASARRMPENKSIPGVVFLRGGAVAILLILRTSDTPAKPVLSFQDSDHVVLTVQPRIAVPDLNYAEIPAGMLDGQNGEFSGTAARELEEETGLVIGADELVELTGRGVYPSPGACDEFLRLFACEKRVSQNELETIKGKLSGLRDEGEFITLRLARMKDLCRETSDMKTLAALCLWDRLVSERMATNMAGLSTGALIGILCAGFAVAMVVAAYLMSVCTKRMEKSMSKTDAAPPAPESPMPPRISEEGTLAPSFSDISKHV
ncbi:hypothetical protein GGI15_002876 [Coemansia interrupta]|uniref:Nudix hydrolase domain-containing protein n=1 Tax=Coemansia interrupta TaxID=1126814 RepID=A0A9W8HAA2_9FUNG|nr:hypothetical protein GGI15_002876 [Coemansia interrupta]